MAEITTLSVRHHCWDDSPTLISWTIQESPSNKRVSWTGHATARPQRLRKAECREVLTSSNSLPSIHVHGAACRCSQANSEAEVEDALLAAKISALTKTVLSTKPPPPAKPPVKQSRSRPGTSIPSSNSLLSTLARLFSPPPSSSQLPPSLPLQADLCIAASDLDVDKVARYLVHPAPSPLPGAVSVNAPNHLGVTPLMAAVRSPAAAAGLRPKAQLEMVRFLVEGCGADVEATRVDRVTGLGESVLSMACGAGAGAVVRYLIGRGVVVDRRLPSGRGIGRGVAVGRGRTALHVAVLADRVECVETLLREGKAAVNAVFDAADEKWRGGEGGLKGLRGRTRSVSREARDKRPRHPVSALHLAHASPACTRVLLECGASASAKDGYGRTPLHWAAEGGNADVVRLLLDAGADSEPTAADGTTPLGAVVEALEDGQGKQGHIEVARLLLRAGAHHDLGIQGEDDLKQRLLSTKFGEAFQYILDDAGASCSGTEGLD